MPGKHFKKPFAVSKQLSNAEQIAVEKRASQPIWTYIRKWLLVAVVLAILLLNIFTHLFGIVRYNGTGMEPGLTGGQTLVVQKVKKVKAGDVIAFYYNNQILVRRVICTGGEQIEIDENGVVSVGGNKLEEPYLKNITLGQCNITFPYYVHIGTVFVMGDNRLESMDSRLKEIGTVPEDRIIGKVILDL